jgi:twitching motility protein PilJ
MARQLGNSLFNSLRGKIWISTSVLAFFTCTFGLISYLVVSLLVNDVFYGVFIPFLVLAFVTMIFGWWLSNEIVDPIEKVTLLAKSLERSTSTSIPRTSGSTETDQLLQTIQRNNQQFQKIVSLMENVANGNLDVKSLEGSDRLSASFQKLLSKVSESISAKAELDTLRISLTELRMDVSGVKSGNLDVEISNNNEETRELSETFKYLIDNLVRLISAVQAGSSAAETSVSLVDSDIQQLVQRDENRIQEMAQASLKLKKVPNLIKKITEDLMSSAESARQTIQKAQHGSQIATDNSESVGHLRKQVRENVKRIQNLNERTHDIERVAKTVEDLANRTNMIALNASIQATELGEDGHGFVLVAEEVERLAVRANGTNKQISKLNKSILAEIRKVESSVEMTMGEVASLSKFAIESSNVLNEMGRYVSQFLNLQENLISYSKDESEEADNAFTTLQDSISETETTVSKLKDSSVELDSLAKAMKDLRSHISEFRLAKDETHSDSESEIEPESYTPEGADDALYEEFVSKEFESDGSSESESEIMVHEESLDQQTVDSDDTLSADSSFESEDLADTSNKSEAFSDDVPEFDESLGSIENRSESEVLAETASDSSDSEEYEDEMVAESYKFADSKEPRPEEFDSTEFSGLDMYVDTEGSQLQEDEARLESSPAESDENGVFDLYDASLNSEDPTGDFDSGEFTIDELIDEVGSLELAEVSESDSNTYVEEEDILDALPEQFIDKNNVADPDNTLSI